MVKVDYDKPIFKAAAVQAASVYRDKPVYLDVKATLEKACELIREAAAKGARLVVFPETFIPGYPHWSLTLTRLPEWSFIWRILVKNSVEVPGPETETLSKVAKETNTYLVVGINERDRHYGSRMYNSALFISPMNGVMGVHRKLHPTIHELLYHTRGDGGDNIRVYETELGNIGGLICGEHLQLPLIYHMVMQGEQINCSLWPGARELEGKGDPRINRLNTEMQIMTRAASIAGQMFAVSASYYIPEDQIPQDFYDNVGFKCTGGSSIVAPTGEYLAGPSYNEETILYSDIDLGLIPERKSINSLTCMYSRWDLFTLLTRERPYQPLLPMELLEAGISKITVQDIDALKEKIMNLEEKIRLLEDRRTQEKATR